MRISDWSSDVCSSDLAGLHEIAERHPAARCLETEPGEAVEQDGGERGKVADDICEDADIECLLHQPLKHILVGAPGPEQRGDGHVDRDQRRRSEEHTSELQSLMRNSYAVFCLKKKKK